MIQEFTREEKGKKTLFNNIFFNHVLDHKHLGGFTFLKKWSGVLKSLLLWCGYQWLIKELSYFVI